MEPRTILYTGKGGVGKTSVAASTALRCAAAGLRTLIMSTDTAHSLRDVLTDGHDGAPLAVGPAGPTQAADGVWALEIDSQSEMSRHWSGVQGWLGDLLVDRGIDRIAAEELTVPPGLDELFSLLALLEQRRSGEWDVIIVDCAPTGETLRMLSFPEVARWWLRKVFPSEQRLLAVAAPIARSVLDVPLPSRAALGDLQRLSENLIAMNELLLDTRTTSVRLVMNPDRMVIGEAMRTFTYLNLYGYLTDAVIVNRVFPDDVGDYFTRWRAVQQEHLVRVRDAFEPVPVLRAPYFEEEVVGETMLARLGEALFPDASDAAAILHETVTQSLSSTADGAVLRIALPLADREQVTLKQVGVELVVTAAGRRRTITLPSTLASMHPTGARLQDGALEVSFSDA